MLAALILVGCADLVHGRSRPHFTYEMLEGEYVQGQWSGNVGICLRMSHAHIRHIYTHHARNMPRTMLHRSGAISLRECDYPLTPFPFFLFFLFLFSSCCGILGCDYLSKVELNSALGTVTRNGDTGTESTVSSAGSDVGLDIKM